MQINEPAFTSLTLRRAQRKVIGEVLVEVNAQFIQPSGMSGSVANIGRALAAASLQRPKYEITWRASEPWYRCTPKPERGTRKVQSVVYI